MLLPLSLRGPPTLFTSAITAKCICSHFDSGLNWLHTKDDTQTHTSPLCSGCYGCLLINTEVNLSTGGGAPRIHPVAGTHLPGGGVVTNQSSEVCRTPPSATTTPSNPSVFLLLTDSYSEGSRAGLGKIILMK